MSDREDLFLNQISAGREHAKLKAERDFLKQTNKMLLQQLDDARAVRGMVIPERVNRNARGKTYVRLVIGDLHGNHYEPSAVATLLKDIANLDIREIVLLGDMVECGGFLDTKHTLGYVAQTDENNYEEDIASTNDFLDKLQNVCPHAEIHYLEGNHEKRVEQWCVTVAKTSTEQSYLRRLVAPETLLGLAKRGIHYYRLSEKYMGVSSPGTIKLGHCYFTHGWSHAQHAARKHIEKAGGCICFGHTHRKDCEILRKVHPGLLGGWNPGCLCVLQPRWHHSDPTEWTHGYDIHIVDENKETFQVIPTNIYDGVSYLNVLYQTAQQ